MQRVERSARIGASPAELFDYLADLRNLPEWQSGVVSAEVTSDGEIREGATATVVRELMGQRIAAPLSVTEFDRPHRLVIGGEVSGVTATAALDLAEAGNDETDLRFEMEIRGSGLTSFMEPMIARAAATDVDASLERVQQRFAEPA